MKNKNDVEQEMKCPYCGEMNEISANTCKKCGRILNTDVKPTINNKRLVPLFIVVAVFTVVIGGTFFMKSNTNNNSQLVTKVDGEESAGTVDESDTSADVEETAEAADIEASTDTEETTEPTYTEEPAQEDITPEATVTSDSTVYTSKHIWEQAGTLYTVDPVWSEGFYCVSGNYTDTMVLYNGYVYLRSGASPSAIIRMNLDGSDQQVIASDASANKKICIYEGYLYYTSFGDTGTGKRINLETGAAEEMGPYIFRAGNDEVWVYTNMKENKWYISDPCYINIRETKEITGNLLGINGQNIFYMYKDNNDYVTCRYNATEDSTYVIAESPYKSIMAENGLYFKSMDAGNTVLHRMDVEDGTVTQYDLGYFNVYMSGGFSEVGNRTFFVQFVAADEENNEQLWVFDREDSSMHMVGSWYNPNAISAAAES